MDRPQMVGIGFAIAAAGVGTFGLMQSEPLPPSARLGAMASLDSSNDGRISKEEWAAAGRPANTWGTLDVNGNGYVDPAEVKPQRGGGARR
jgi:hypothetical protein